MDIAKIEDLKVDFSKRLTADEKNRLILLVEREFDHQSTLFNFEVEKQRKEWLETYRREVGYAKLKKEHDKAKRVVEVAQAKVSSIERELLMLALTVDGSLSYLHSVQGSQEKFIEVSKQLDGLSAQKRAGHNIKSKVIARILLASTAGEMTVILREVLGNGVIPTVSKAQLAQLTVVGSQGQ